MADEDELAAVRDVREGAVHRVQVAGGVEDGRWQLAAARRGHLGERALGVAGRREDAALGGDAEGGADEVELALRDVEHRHVGALRLRELRGAEADGPRAEDERLLALSDRAAVDGVRADAQRLDERELLVGELRRLDELALGRAQVAAPPHAHARVNEGMWARERKRACGRERKRARARLRRQDLEAGLRGV